MKRQLLGLAVAWIACSAHAASFEDFLPCEPLDPSQQYHDINESADQVARGTVERNHFIPAVETLQRGQTAPLPRDIAFVLRQFPNHYRALNAMARWQLRNKLPIDEPENQVWTADCYFQRAIAFRPDDWQIHFIYGIYLHGAKRLEEAERAYKAAEENGADGPNYYYNRGLLDVDLGHLDAADANAEKAYGMGASLPGLRDKIARARKATQAAQPIKKPKPSVPATQRKG